MMTDNLDLSNDAEIGLIIWFNDKPPTWEGVVWSLLASRNQGKTRKIIE
jgi:hypothetical protein